MGTDRNFSVRVEAPASLSNLGPGFDAFGLCIEGISDQVIVSLKDEPGVEVAAVEGLTEGIPTDATNTAAVGAREILDRSQIKCGIKISIIKGIRIGSGIGGSAASAVAGAVATNELLGRPLSDDEVLAAGLEAERSAAGAIHGDNVLPCMLGGFVLTTPGAPTTFRRYEVSSNLHIPLLLPHFTVLTEDARAVLPRDVPLVDAAVTAAAAAHALAALLAGDLESFGAAIMRDRLVEPQRAKLIGFYSAVKQAALDAGAFGCALSGSGPAMFAVTDGADKAQSIADAMLEALRNAGQDGRCMVVHADNSGVKIYRTE